MNLQNIANKFNFQFGYSKKQSDTSLMADAIFEIAKEAVEQDKRIAAIEDTIAKLQAVIDHFQRTDAENRNQ